MYSFPTVCSLEYRDAELSEAHPAYTHLLEMACRAHSEGRNPNALTEQDIQRSRLYCYAYRRQAIGVFHATRVLLEAEVEPSAACKPHRLRARELLSDLANLSVELIPTDFRALLGTLYRYEISIHRCIQALREDAACGGGSAVQAAAERFEQVINSVRGSCGIELSRDDECPEQASFVVPNLGITIIPLVYGDHHSWNLAWLNPEQSDVPFHQHAHGVEIHLGYGPMQGHMVLGGARGLTKEGYALPIPPNTRHGYVNDSNMAHNLPFIFGSQRRSGWGIFFDVDPQPIDLSNLDAVEPYGPRMNHAVPIEQRIAAFARLPMPTRRCILPSSLTDRDGTGGIELHLIRAPEKRSIRICPERFLACSVVQGAGELRMLGETVNIEHHHHFAVPAGIEAEFIQRGPTPLVLMDADLRPSRSKRIGAHL